ncbi:MAG: winged helix-turn-helix transcriptional regulator [Candidatus Diapherotrites archaeon]|nr:winged helix-turn-helix transcriptional regulator [Candidatus Diapherotrites archaeon]
MLDREQVLALGVRKEIFELIKQSPGLHFREIKRRTNLAIGALQYHLNVLEKNNFVRSEKKGKFTRYFLFSSQETAQDQGTLSLLRDENIRKITLFILEHKQATNKQLSEFLQLSPSTVTFHVKKLIVSNMIVEQHVGRETFYALVQPDQVKQLLVSYRKTFLDSLVDNFVDVWQGLDISTPTQEESVKSIEP